MNWGKDEPMGEETSVADARDYFKRKTRGMALTEGERRDFARETNSRFRTIMTADELDD